MSDYKTGLVRIGFIGCGSIANKKHLPALRALNAEVRAFYDTNNENAQDACRQYGSDGAIVYGNAEDLIADPDINTICICTPNSTHARYSIAALNNKKHVMCEKPIAVKYNDAKEMVRAAQQNNRILRIALQNRYTDKSIFAKKILDQGFFGNIYHVKAQAVRRRSVMTFGAFLNSGLQGGGPLIDIGTHALDLAVWLTGNSEPLYASANTYNLFAKRGSDANRWGNWEPSKFEVEDSCFGFIMMKDGMTLTIDAAWTMNTREEFESCVSIYGDEGGMEMRGDVSLTYEIGGKMCDIKPELTLAPRPMAPDVKIETPGYKESLDFINAIQREEKQDYSQYLAVAKIIDVLYESSRKKQPVYFD